MSKSWFVKSVENMVSLVIICKKKKNINNRTAIYRDIMWANLLITAGNKTKCLHLTNNV